jgi:hypothetical protein
MGEADTAGLHEETVTSFCLKIHHGTLARI